jgi:TRAP transporter TAXI family solute receptor
MRRLTLLLLAGVLALIAAAAVAIYAASLPTTLTVAVGPANVDNHRLVTLLAQLLQRERGDVRLRVRTTEGAAASAALLQAGGADLAVVRSDVDYPPDGLAVANIRRDILLFLARPEEAFASVAELRGKAVGVVFAQGANQPLLRRVLAHYGIGEREVRIEAVTAAEAGASLKEGRIDAVFSVGNPSARPFADLVASVGQALGAAPQLLGVSQAEGIARGTATVEATELVRGAFGGSPPRPPETVPTLGIVHRLVAHRSVPEAPVAALTQLVFALRPALAGEQPLAAQLEAPDTDRGGAVPVHPGAIQYIEGNIKTFLDRYGDWFYVIVMVVGIVGSAIAGLASLAASQAQARRPGDIGSLVGLIAAVRAASDEAALDEVETQVDALLATSLERIAARELDASQTAAFALGFDQARRALADRRAALRAR